MKIEVVKYERTLHIKANLEGPLCSNDGFFPLIILLIIIKDISFTVALGIHIEFRHLDALER